MTRINVFYYGNPDDPGYEGPVRVGHFSPESAEVFEEDTRWDGNSNVSVNPVGSYGHQMLYRTRGGRWVLHEWSQWQGVREKYEFVSDETARDWLLRNREDAAVEKWFGKLEDEAGPDLGGRPEIGGRIDVMIGTHLRDEVDAYASTLKMNRGEAVRLLLADGLKFGKKES